MKLKSPSRTAMTLTIGMVLLVATTIFAQQLSTPNETSEVTAKQVVDMVERFHIGQVEIDDDVSGQLLKRFVESLDPQKLYFTADDIAGMQKYRTQLDDMLRDGDVEFAYDTFDLYVRRLKERTQWAHDYIDMEHDFTVDESMVTDPEDLSWARTTEDLKERWRKRIKYDLLTLKLDGTELEDARERLHKRYKNIERTMVQTEDHETLEDYLSALTHCFDPHSSYMSPETLEDFRIAMERSLEGIGAALRSEDGYTTVAQIVPGGAAEKDGRLKVGDKIIGVAQGDEEEFVDVVEMKLSKVVRYIRGKKGTVVKLQVKKAGKGNIETYALTRQKIELKSGDVRGEIIEIEQRIDGRRGRIGVVNIPSFYRDFRGAQRGVENFKSTARDLEKVLLDFRDQGGVDAVVVDLRTNGGGALSEAIEVSGLFIDRGPVVQVKEQDGDKKTHDDVKSGVMYSGPLVVLTNRLSASASEIFAGVIKDYERGIVVGDKTTHGKGTVQNVMPVGKPLFQFLNPQKRGALKLTINQFYRVNGASTQNKGVPSDVVLPSKLDHMDLGEAFLDNALGFNTIEPAPHEDVGMVSSDVVSELRRRSEKRIADDEEFQKIQREIDQYLQRKNRKTVPLQESKLRAEREEQEDEAEDDEDETEEQPGEGPVFPEGAYNDEVLEVTLDYVELLRNLKTAGK